MTDEERDRTIAEMCGKIESLQFLLKVVIATLPEDHRNYILLRLSEFSRYTEDEAARKDTDPARDSAAAVFDTTEYFDIRVEEEVEVFAVRNETYTLK
ncbi:MULTISPECIES: hypothetical protein [unclassified Ensifer]|uniref:hypothetical protein n=1 Tax=unclassified Ensifer TaxID=2633371 RepID=UPI000813B7F5|nr:MULTISPECIES: hypothetical protein [unclassified Ensifer]OCP08409.1 hypothetical protein BBX50_20135 [Ensifer sp. LC11]OCP09028.1 hypothetical protein BC374_19925 [Ensifer sp. LC13]OCP09811.1 hypothetical protein BC362_08700 [Ensifer sp. LC14]OCP32282.1 hypothetical protein BC364_19255 [Ensifer sp. LC499]